MPEGSGVNSPFREWNASDDIPPDQKGMLHFTREVHRGDVRQRDEGIRQVFAQWTNGGGGQKKKERKNYCQNKYFNQHHVTLGHHPIQILAPTAVHSFIQVPSTTQHSLLTCVVHIPC